MRSYHISARIDLTRWRPLNLHALHVYHFKYWETLYNSMHLGGLWKTENNNNNNKLIKEYLSAGL